MACGSCSQRYDKNPFIVTGNSKGSRLGVIKDKAKTALIRQEQERYFAAQKGEVFTPKSPTPVDGASGPSNETE